jgi:Ca2+/Na+ antiporter
MSNQGGFTIVVIDGATASALSQILPVLLLTLMVELRRTALHRSLSRTLIGSFFFLFGVIETVLVLSIDGMLYPFQIGDLLSALVIFTLLTLIFAMSFAEPRERPRDDPNDGS